MTTRTMMEPETLFSELDEPFALTPDAIQSYRVNGHVTLKQCLSHETLEYYGEVITDLVISPHTQAKPMSELSTYEKAFVQVMNLWRKNDDVRTFVFSRRLAQIAARMMGVQGTRLYHDQALYKEVGGGFTPWHADQFYWPFQSPNTVTAWIPLQDTPLDMGPVMFAERSQHSTVGRDLIIGDESEATLGKAIQKLNFKVQPKPFELGDVSFHAGWTYHRAGPNVTATPRRVMTIIYMDRDITISQPKRKEQETDRQAWLSSLPIGSIPDGPLNPILYEP